jgi:hypothetical protein
LIALAFLSAMVEVAIFRSFSHPRDLYLWNYWTAPAWLAWYLLAAAIERRRVERIGADL